MDHRFAHISRHGIAAMALGATLTASGCYAGIEGLGADDGAGQSGDGDDSGPGDGGPDAQCRANGPRVGEIGLVRLTRKQYVNTVGDLLGIDGESVELAADEKVGPFSANTIAPVDGLTVEQYKRGAEDLALVAAQRIPELLPCQPQPGAEAACAQQFIETFGRRAYRRPLAADEVSRYAALHAGRDDFDDGIRLVVQTMLQSPHFLYRVEFGEPPEGSDDLAALTSYETATRLSYFLWNTMPDDALLDAAGAGELGTAADLRVQAERLLDDPRSRDTIESFHVQWLEVETAGKLDKDIAVFPAYDTELGEAMVAEVGAFADYVLREGDGRLETLLTAPYAFAEGPLLDLYGVQAPPNHDPTQPVAVPADQRAGLLTQPALLAVHAHSDQTSPVARGALVRENFLCTPLPPPPPDVDNTPPIPEPGATGRELFEQHRNSPACAGCHVLIDGLGLGFENYDGMGAFRDIEAGKPVDASGEIVATEDINGPFVGAVELAGRLASSDDVRACVATQWFRYAFMREASEEDACSMEIMLDEFQNSDFSVRELVLAMVTTDAFRYRREVTK